MANTMTPDQSGVLSVGTMIDTAKGIAHVRDIVTHGDIYLLRVYYDSTPPGQTEPLTLLRGDIITVIHDRFTEWADPAWYDENDNVVWWEEEVELD